MKKFMKRVFTAAVILFALAGLLVTVGSFTGLYYYGTFKEDRRGLADEFDEAMKQFSGHFSHISFTRNGIVMTDARKLGIKYGEKVSTFYPDHLERLKIEADRANVYLIQTYAEDLRVTVQGNIDYRCEFGGDILTISPPSGYCEYIGPNPDIIIQIPRNHTFSEVSIHAKDSYITADAILSMTTLINAERCNIRISDALVADKGLMAALNLSKLYVNCINTENFELYSNLSKVNVGITNAIRSIRTASDFSEVIVLLPDTYATRAMEISNKGNGWGRILYRYE